MQALMSPQATMRSGLTGGRPSIVFSPALIQLTFDYVASSYAPPKVTRTDVSSHERLYPPNEVKLKKCFASFSLVCKGWRALAQSYLYDTLALRFTFAQLPKQRTLQRILEWQRTNPSLVAHVHHLRLTMSEPFFKVVPTSGCEPKELRQVIRGFAATNLHSIKLCDMRFDLELVKVYLREIDQDVARLPLFNTKRLEFYHSSSDHPLTSDAVQIPLLWFADVGEVIIHTEYSDMWFVRQTVDQDYGQQLVPADLKTPSLTMTTGKLPESLIQSLRASPTFQEGVLQKLNVEVDLEGQPVTEKLFIPPPPGLSKLHLDLSFWLRSEEYPCTLSIYLVSTRSSNSHLSSSPVFVDTEAPLPITAISLKQLVIKVPSPPIKGFRLLTYHSLFRHIRHKILPMFNARKFRLVICMNVRSSNVHGNFDCSDSSKELALKNVPVNLLEDAVLGMPAFRTFSMKIEKRGRLVRLLESQKSEVRQRLPVMSERGLLRL